MKFTLSKTADKKIAKDLDKIVNYIVEKFNPISIIMFGGFGHGGGSFRTIRGKIVPLNDYDLYLITKKSINDKELESAGEECSKIIGRGGKEIVENFSEKYDLDKFFHVDLHTIEHKKLKNLYPTQRSFDLKTSQVIYGNKDVLKQIPNIKISKSDAIRLLFNKLNHFMIAGENSDVLKSIYAVKGFTDLCSAVLIWRGKYAPTYQGREKAFQKMNFPAELKYFVKLATKSKLYRGYEVKNVDKFYEESKKWVEWGLKTMLKECLSTESEDWKTICSTMFRKIPYFYFNDYLDSKYLFLAQYYLNVKFFLSGLRKKEFLIKSLLRWKDAGLIIAIALMLYSFGEKKESERYLKKITNNTQQLKSRILKLYSVYYLQKLV